MVSPHQLPEAALQPVLVDGHFAQNILDGQRFVALRRMIIRAAATCGSVTAQTIRGLPNRHLGRRNDDVVGHRLAAEEAHQQAGGLVAHTFPGDPHARQRRLAMEQRRSSLSTPTMATSSGTRRLASRQKRVMSQPAMSLTAKRPTGFGRLRKPVSELADQGCGRLGWVGAKFRLPDRAGMGHSGRGKSSNALLGPGERRVGNRPPATAGLWPSNAFEDFTSAAVPIPARSGRRNLAPTQPRRPQP